MTQGKTRRRKPTRVTVDLFAGTTDATIARIGTIEYVDGKPDAGSIKLEADT